MRKDALRLFDLPASVLTPPGVDQVAKNRTPIPSTAAMLHSFGYSPQDSHWLEVAYRILGQVTHATPLGYLHCLRYADGEWIPNEISFEMLALSLDVTAIGGGYLLGTMGVLFSNVAPAGMQQYRALRDGAGAVHRAAREMHSLGLKAGHSAF